MGKNNYRKYPILGSDMEYIFLFSVVKSIYWYSSLQDDLGLAIKMSKMQILLPYSTSKDFS